MIDMPIAILDVVERVVCNQVTRDQHPVGNILLGPFSPGFLCEHFVRAPVNIQIQFKKSISLGSVDLGVCVGAQRVEAFEFYAGKNGIDDVMSRIAFVNLAKHRPDSSSSVHTVQLVTSSPPAENALFGIEPAVGVAQFVVSKRQLLQNINCLAIKIVRAKSVPCLRYISLFGQVLIDHSNIDHHFLPVVAQSNHSNRLIDTASSYLVSCDEVEMTSTEDVVVATAQIGNTPIINQSLLAANMPHFVVPDDFVDPITCEVMSLPILLPSGKSVDRSTLERYCDEQSRFGRSANDPFTGLRFNDMRKPLPNVALKARIDRYVLENPEIARLENVGRTLCGKRFDAWSGASVAAENCKRRRIE